MFLFDSDPTVISWVFEIKVEAKVEELLLLAPRDTLKVVPILEASLSALVNDLARLRATCPATLTFWIEIVHFSNLTLRLVPEQGQPGNVHEEFLEPHAQTDSRG